MGSFGDCVGRTVKVFLKRGLVAVGAAMLSREKLGGSCRGGFDALLCVSGTPVGPTGRNPTSRGPGAVTGLEDGKPLSAGRTRGVEMEYATACFASCFWGRLGCPLPSGTAAPL